MEKPDILSQLKLHVSNMKHIEDKLQQEINELSTRRATVMSDRMALESFIDWNSK